MSMKNLNRMKSQAGMTMTEFVIAMGVAGSVMAVTLTYSVDWMVREDLRSSTRTIQSAIQLNRMEAVNRNRPCRMVLNPGTNAVEVWDTMGTPDDTTDDKRLHTTTLPASIAFESPDDEEAVTLDKLNDGSYEVMFGADGTVASGSGSISLKAASNYRQVDVHVAGGIQTKVWEEAEGDWDDGYDYNETKGGGEETGYDDIGNPNDPKGDPQDPWGDPTGDPTDPYQDPTDPYYDPKNDPTDPNGNTGGDNGFGW